MFEEEDADDDRIEDWTCRDSIKELRLPEVEEDEEEEREGTEDPSALLTGHPFCGAPKRGENKTAITEGRPVRIQTNPLPVSFVPTRQP